MARSTTATCCLTLPLKLEKWQEDRLAKRFELARQIYNTLVRYELKKLNGLKQTPEYRDIQRQLHELPKGDAKDVVKKRKALYKQRQQLLKNAGFSEYAFTGDMKNFYKHFSDNIGSNVAVHGISKQVWAAFEKVLFGNGKRVHFKRKGDIHSLQGYSAAGKSGGIEIMFRGTCVEWKGLYLPLKLDPNNAYEEEMLQNRVKYVRLCRKPGKNKDHWYAQLVLEGLPAIKRDRETGERIHPVGHGAVGIDIGPQTIAYVSDRESDLLELADQVQNIERKKRLLQRKMDRSRRAMNPDNYAPDGTIKRGVKLTRNKSKRYIKLQQQLAYVQHYQAETRKRQHIALANHLLTLGDTFYIEDMDWPALAHRAKETTVSEKTGRYNRKKRFGKSLANKAPATFTSILTQKCQSLGLPGVQKVPTTVKASQYNHLSKEYIKKELSQRWNDMPDGRRLQRDLYSAFLLQHINVQENHFDQAALERDYEVFVKQHDEVIRKLSLEPKTVASMGVKRSRS